MAPNPDLACGILTNIGELWSEEEFCDLTINIDDYQFRCHKFHLSANSAFFKTLLRSEKTDGFTDSISHVTIRGITPEILGLVMKAVYKGENCVDENNVIQIWHAAHELQIDVLVSKCEDFVMSNMTLDNYENIYHSSVLLESARVRTFAVEFMAEHFDKFRETSLFLELPSKFLMDVVGSEVLVVESREDLVNFIVMWSRYKSGDDNESDDKTEVMNADGLINDETKGDKQCVEVMFSQPPAGLGHVSSRRKLRQILQETERREETLGKLLNLAKLEQTSSEYLKNLMENDWLMGIKEARNTVWASMTTFLTAKPETVEEVIEPPTTSSTFKNSIKDAAVYKLQNSDTVLVHRGTTGKRYKLLTNVDVLNSKLGYTFYNTPPEYYPQSNTSDQSQFKCIVNGKDIASAELKLLQDTSRPVVVGKYLYNIYSHKDLCRIELSNEEDASKSWHFVGRIPASGELRWTAVHGETIITAYPVTVKTREGSKTEMSLYNFDTTTLTAKCLGQYVYTGLNDAIVYTNNEMYILQGDGSLWHVKLKSAPGTCLSRTATLWTFRMQLYSVIKLQDDLIIFGNLPVDKILPTHCKDLNLNLKFVQAWPSDKCRHVWLPESWLGEEI